MKLVLILWAGIGIIFLFLLDRSAFAVTTSIINYPSTITTDSFTITASISGATTATNYLRIDMYKDGSNNYFGETYNGSDWYGGSTYSQYYAISVVSGTFWNGTIMGRIGSPSTTDYDGTGTYKIRVRRYTNAGGYTSSEASNSAQVIAISVPTSTPTPTTATTTPSPTSVPPTNTPTNTPTPKLSPTFTATPIASVSPKLSITQGPTASVLGESESADLESSTSSSKVIVESISQDSIPKILIGLGVVLLGTCGILAFRAYRNNFKNENL